jgi:hypothetical protein
VKSLLEIEEAIAKLPPKARRQLVQNIPALCPDAFPADGWAAILNDGAPRMENHNLCEVVQDIPPGAAKCCWTLRADNHGHHHSRIRLSKSPLYLELHWRPTADDSAQRVGVFRLDLTGLLRDGYIRPEQKDSYGSNVRLRVFRADDGSFYVQTNQHGPRLLLCKTSLSTS